MWIVPWIASLLSVVGIVLNAQKDIRCWPVWLASNAFWIVHTAFVSEWAALVTWLAFVGANAYGWMAWSSLSWNDLFESPDDRVVR